MQNFTILIVDDEPDFRQILQVVLHRAGYRTVTAADADEAQLVIATQKPHLVILDDMMPGMSGGDLCRKLKADPATRTLPILLYSAGVRVHDKAYIAEIGADGVMFKPCPPADIVATVNRHLSVNV